MSNFAALVQNENMKIYRRIRTWVMVGLLILTVLAAAILISYFSNESDRAATNWLDFMMQSTGFVFLASVFTIVIASDIVASEFTWGTIKLLLIRPVKRWKILLAKYAATLLFSLFLLVILFAISVLTGGIAFGFGGSTRVDGGLGEVLRGYGFQVVNLIITATFAFMISSVFRSSALAVSLSLVIMFVGNSISGTLMALKIEWGKYLLFTNMDLSIYFNESMKSFLLPGMSLGFSVAVLAVYFVVFHVISFLVFIKRDVSA